MVETAGWLVVLTLSLGCGRLNYEESSGAISTGDGGAADAITADAAPTGEFVVGLSTVTAPGSFSLVDLDVDWTRNLAYASSRKSDECILMIDIADRTNPTLLRELAPPDTTAGTCIGLAWLGGDNNELAFGAGGGTLERWQLIDPREGPPEGDGQTSAAMPRRMAFDGGTNLWMVEQAGSIQHVDLTTAIPNKTAVSSLGSCEVNQVAYSNGVLVSACYDNNSPIVTFDAGSGSPTGTPIDMTAVGDSGTWSSAATDTGLVFQGGWVAALVMATADGSILRSRWDNTGVYRGADMRGDVLVTAQALGGDVNVVERWDVSNPDEPRLVARGQLEGMTGEIYEIRLDPEGRQAVAVGNDGQVAVVDIDALPATDAAYPSF